MSGLDVDLGHCDVCEAEPAVGVAAIPGVPMSICWGATCLRRGVLMPLWTADYTVATCIPPFDPDWKHTAEWFREGMTYVDGEYMRIDSLTLAVRTCPNCEGSGQMMSDGSEEPCQGCFEGFVVSLVAQ
jgi:hypothetical protein